MSSVSFRNHLGFWRETLTVTGWAGLAGLIAPLVTSLPLAVAAPAAALFGGSVGAALTRTGPAWARVLLGTAGGALAALGYGALATRFGLGAVGPLLGGALGGLAIGTLLSSDEDDVAAHPQLSTTTGAVGGAVLGATGVAAVGQIAQYAAAEQSPVLVASAVSAGLMGLWVAAGAGARRLEKVRDPILVRADKLANAVADPVRARVREAAATFENVQQHLITDALGPVMREESERHARTLMEALLDVGENYQHMCATLAGPELKAVEEKLADLNLRTQTCDDPITLGHLTRAAQALRAQQAALDGLRVGKQRAEAAIDAQVALLDRMRLALSRARTDNAEQTALELEAVADQVERLTDDLDSLSAAIAEAESYADRRLLADVERAGRRALSTLERKVEHEEREEVAVH